MACLGGFSLNAGGQKACIFLICVGFVDFANGDGEHSMLEIRGENSEVARVSVCLGV